MLDRKLPHRRPAAQAGRLAHLRAGLRGKLATFNNENILEWTAGVFRTENDDDIITVASTINGRGYFTNAGTTLRQGLELGAQYHDRRLMLYSNYAYIDATFQTANVFSSPDNPSGFECIPGNPDAGNCINVTPGSRLPGVPRHRFKAGFDYWLTPEWKFGSDLITVERPGVLRRRGNLNEPLAGYTSRQHPLVLRHHQEHPDLRPRE